jgi:hypothetical protein
MFTDDEKRAILSHFEEAWGEVVDMLPPEVSRRAAAVDVMRDYAVDKTGIRREFTEDEDQWLVEQAEMYV